MWSTTQPIMFQVVKHRQSRKREKRGSTIMCDILKKTVTCCLNRYVMSRSMATIVSNRSRTLFLKRAIIRLESYAVMRTYAICTQANKSHEAGVKLMMVVVIGEID